MKSKFYFLYFFMIFLSAVCLIVSGHAATESSPCTSYYTAYQNAVVAYNTALEAVQKAEILYRKAIPGSFPIPSNLKHLEKEYNSDPDAFLKKVKEGVYTHPNIPKNLSRTQAFLDGWLDVMDMASAQTAKSDAQAAYDAATATLEVAETALEACQGMTVVTIYCERGVSCQSPPGSGQPKGTLCL